MNSRIACAPRRNAGLVRLSIVGVMLASAAAQGEELRFGGWLGEINVKSSIPISIHAYHFEGESSSSLRLMCTPPGWAEESETVSKPIHQGLLMDHSSGVGVQEQQGPCVIQARGVAHGGHERVVRSMGSCGGSAMDAGSVDQWADILDLLGTVVISADERPRITVQRDDGSEFTFVAPNGSDTSRAMSWMHDACMRARKTEGRILLPGPTYGVWITQYTYDEFHERILAGSIQAMASSGGNEVAVGCGGQVSVFHRAEGCPANESDGNVKSCSILARIDGSPAIERSALCKSLCFLMEGYSKDATLGSAMITGKRARIRVSGPNYRHRRDFELSLWGFRSAHGWVETKCAASRTEVE